MIIHKPVLYHERQDVGIRYKAYCPQCKWASSEWRRSEDTARSDGLLHAAAPGKAAA